jgi:hypothetical protein
MRFHAVLPALTAVDDHDPATLYDPVWHGSVGFVWQFAIALPGPISTTMRISNWRFHVTLPMLTSPQDGPSNVDAHGCPICGGDVLTNLSIHVKLPKLKAHGEFTAPVTGLRAFVVLPALAMSHGLAGAVLLPSLRASARLSWTTDALGAPATALRRGWAMNLQNIAVTEFSGFEFRAMGRAYDQHFAVGLDGGLYRMGGDTDDGAPIAWAWESGLADFGMAAQKGLLALYVDGHFANSAVFSIQSDVARRIYGHRAKGYLFNHQPHRIPLGRGVRTHGIGIGMADESGGYLELDRITPEYTITSRNI